MGQSTTSERFAAVAIVWGSKICTVGISSGAGAALPLRFLRFLFLSTSGGHLFSL